MTPRELESFEKVAALRESLGATGEWICTVCSYVALYEDARKRHERQYNHEMKETE